MAEVEDVAGKISIKSDDPNTVAGINVDNAVKATPFLGQAVTVGKDAGAVFKAFGAPHPDGADITLGLTTIATDTTGFIQSSSQAIVDIATDPLGWLIGQGLNFLISAVQPIQDAIHFVSGDGPALGIAAENFGAIAKGLQDLAKNFAEVAESSLAQWQGDAATAAKTSLGEFAHGVDGVAAKSGDLAQMLQLSSMLMTFVEELIKAILTELITWLVMIWVPAIAAAIPTAGASTAAAGTASEVKLATTSAKTTQKVSKLRKILQDVLEWLKKLMAKLKETRFGKALMEGKTAGKLKEAKELTKGQGAMEKLFGEKGMLGKRFEKAWENPVLNEDGAIRYTPSLLKNGAKETLKKGREAAFKGVLGYDPTNPGENPAKTVNDHLGKLNSHVKNAKKTSDYGETGTEQSDEETKKDLDF
ncbi:WXG100 family type VII secretion target [Amycolatopsis sp. NPDC059027]|uniref:WXG100 family type VII secretion target n=1 Tax=Amycolatopsis sp. NPDC059027 TaxID=3346709 RepID=UPI003670E5F5